jgi:hypothetical protein
MEGLAFGQNYRPPVAFPETDEILTKSAWKCVFKIYLILANQLLAPIHIGLLLSNGSIIPLPYSRSM